MGRVLRYTALIALLSVSHAYAFAVFGPDEKTAHDETEFVVLKRVAGSMDKEMVERVTRQQASNKTAALESLKSKTPAETRETLIPASYAIGNADACALIAIATMPFFTIALALLLTWSSLSAREKEWRNSRRTIYRGSLNLKRADKVARIQNRFSEIHSRRGLESGVFSIETLADSPSPLPENLTASQLLFLTREDVLAAAPQAPASEPEDTIEVLTPEPADSNELQTPAPETPPPGTLARILDEIQPALEEIARS